MLLPEEVQGFIEAGLAHRLDWYFTDLTEQTRMLGGKIVTGPVTFQCTFLNHYGRCKVHHMKPFEGRMVDHDGYVIDREKDLLDKWRTDEAQKIVEDWIEKYE
jgi:hypothetical protein